MKQTFAVIKPLLLSAICAVCLGGCISFNPQSLRTVETNLLESNPDLQISSRSTFGLGALTIDFIDFAFVHDHDIDLSKISRADIGVYELGSAVDVEKFTMPQTFTGGRSCPRQEVILRVREDEEHMQIVVCIRNDKVTALALFMLEPREVVVINARGDFEALISSLLRSSVKRRSPRYEAGNGEAGNGQAGNGASNDNSRLQSSVTYLSATGTDLAEG